MSRRMEWLLIGLILAAYLVLAWQYAVRTPDWQAPDEPAHVNYVRQIARERRLPTLQMGDWNQPYQDALTAYQFAPALIECTDPPADIPCPGLDSVEYEDHQPPLYYLLQAPVYALTDGSLTVMRLFSALLGAGVVLCTWASLRLLFPHHPYLALTGAGFVAFLPQHVAILASVSNDVLAELVSALTLLTVVVYLGNTRAHTMPPDTEAHRQPVSPLLLGLLVGTALITKTTIYFLAGIAVLAVLLRARRERWPWRLVARHLAAVLIPALLIGGIWWARNVSVYGGLDFTALSRHSEVTIGQPRTADYIDQQLGGSERQYLETFVRTTFHSFWGQFGWMALPMPVAVYRVLLVLTLGLGVGVLVLVWRRGWRDLQPAQRDVLIVFAAVIALVLAEYLLYNRDFVQFQGRYLYPALIPLAALVAAGAYGWTSLLEHRIPAINWLPVTALLGMAAFAWYALDGYIVPNLPAW